MIARTLLAIAILGASSQAWGACVQRCGRCDSCRIHPKRVFVEVGFLLIPGHMGAPQYPDPTPGGVARANYTKSGASADPSKDASQDSILELLTKEIKDIQTVLVALSGGQVSNVPPTPGPPATPENIPPVIFSTCNKCHSGDKPDGDLLLADMLSTEKGRDAADLVVKHGIMPPEADLPEERRNQLRNAIKGIKP